MIPTAAERDALFRYFAKALFKGDIEAPYRVVIPKFRWNYDGVSVAKSLVGAEAFGAHMVEQKAMFSAQRYRAVFYYHLPQITFMTFKVRETLTVDGLAREQRGVECYTFDNEMIAAKDVYRKPSV